MELSWHDWDVPQITPQGGQLWVFWCQEPNSPSLGLSRLPPHGINLAGFWAPCPQQRIEETWPLGDRTIWSDFSRKYSHVSGPSVTLAVGISRTDVPQFSTHLSPFWLPQHISTDRVGETTKSRLTVLEGDQGASMAWFCWKSSSWWQMGFPHCVLAWQKGCKLALWPLGRKPLIPSRRTLPSGPKHLSKAPLQILSHKDQDFNISIRGLWYSVHSGPFLLSQKQLISQNCFLKNFYLCLCVCTCMHVCNAKTNLCSTENQVILVL